MAGWGSPKKELPVGNHVTQIRDVEAIMGKDFNDPNKTNPQFKWGVDYWDGQRWVSHTIYTGQNFADLSQITNPQFIPKLCLLTRACGEPLPKTPQEAAAWKQDSLIGKRFVLSVQKDEMLETLHTRFLPYRTQQQQEQPAAPQEAAPAETPAAAPQNAPEPAMAGAGVAAPGYDPWK